MKCFFDNSTPSFPKPFFLSGMCEISNWRVKLSIELFCKANKIKIRLTEDNNYSLRGFRWNARQRKLHDSIQMKYPNGTIYLHESVCTVCATGRLTVAGKQDQYSV